MLVCVKASSVWYHLSALFSGLVVCIAKPEITWYLLLSWLVMVPCPTCIPWSGHGQQCTVC